MVQFFEISAHRSENGRVVERVEFTDNDSAYWYGTFQGGRIKTPADVRVRLAIKNDGFNPPEAVAVSRWSGAASPGLNLAAVEFSRGGQWIDRSALRTQHSAANPKGSEHAAIIAAAVSFANTVLDQDPDILRRAQIAWHEHERRRADGKAEAARSEMERSLADRAAHEKAIAALEANHMGETVSVTDADTIAPTIDAEASER